MIKTAQYFAICLYWYGREVARLAAYVAAVLTLWVMSL